MKFAFIELVSSNVQDPVYMLVNDFMYYKDREPFKSCSQSLVVFDHVYIAVWPTFILRLSDIIEFNDEASICVSYPLSDIAFGSSQIDRFCNFMNYSY